MYSFTDLASLDNSGKLDFISRWASADNDNSFVILEDKAISLATAKAVFTTPGGKKIGLMQAGLTSSDSSFVIKPFNNGCSIS